MLGTTLGVLFGIAACALLHWLFPVAVSTHVVDVAIVAACGIVGMGLDVRNRTKK
jgi:hypothetical protein